MSDFLTFKDVSIYYSLPKGKELCAIKNFSYNFIKGKKYAIVGYSGSGKSTLLNVIVGSLVFDGDIFLYDKPIESIPVKDRKFTYVNQKYSLFPHLTIYDNIIFPLRNAKADHQYADKKVKDLAKKLNIHFLLTRKPKMISIGQAARVVIAKALINKSDLMIFDEPFSNLDTLTVNKTLKTIKDTASEYNSTIIFVTHDIKEALNIADIILVLNEGELIGTFSPIAFLKTDNEVVKSLRKKIENEKN